MLWYYGHLICLLYYYFVSLWLILFIIDFINCLLYVGSLNFINCGFDLGVDSKIKPLFLKLNKNLNVLGGKLVGVVKVKLIT